jgi:hypothetical protein
MNVRLNLPGRRPTHVVLHRLILHTRVGTSGSTSNQDLFDHPDMPLS